jgi:glycosyltransferase involved in cell wall biosynthesis
MKKILIIVENLPVPFDTRVWKEACALHEAGYRVSVISPRGKGCTQNHEVLDGVHIYRHPAPPEGNSAFGYIREYALSLFWEFLYAWWVFFARGFQVIQGCNPPDNIVFVALPFKLLGVKYIFDHHDANPELYLSKYERQDLLYRIQVWLERITYRFADVVMATNESYKALAVARGNKDPRDVFVVRNGPDLDKFKLVPAQPEVKCGKRFLVGYVGTMSIQDGLDILLDVAGDIRNRGRDDVHFTCVGGGPGLAGLRQLVKEKNLEDTVTFTGRLPDADLLTVLSTADVCVNPDKPCEMNDISTMIKVTEYMALGKPIVQFNLKEGRFSAGESSLYSDPNGGARDFADKILWLLENPGAREAMGAIGRKRVEDELAWKYSVNNLIAAYERAFARRGTRGGSASRAARSQREEMIGPGSASELLDR